MLDIYKIFRKKCTKCACPEYYVVSITRENGGTGSSSASHSGNPLLCMYCGHYPVEHEADSSPDNKAKNSK